MTTQFVGSSSHADSPPFSLIEQKSLASRLAEEAQAAIRDLARDPRSFLKDLFSAETKDAKRRQRIYSGLAIAVIVHAALLIVIAVVGWRTMFVKPAEEAPLQLRAMLPLNEPDRPSAESSVPHGEKNQGGGGGGQHALMPPSEGHPPRMLPLPQVVNLNPSNIPEPTLSVLPTVVGPETPPPPPAPIGDPTGKGQQFSGGPGSDGGIGRGKGTGVGSGEDGGAGPGGRGGKGGGPAGSPDGTGASIPSAIDFNRASSLSGYRSWSWIHRPTPIITPEAQENRVIGLVLLRATFNANGTITDIEVTMSLEFMNESAVEALRRSTFHPATINGVPVTVRKVPIKVFVHY